VRYAGRVVGLLASPFARATTTNFFFFLGLNGFVLLPLHIAQLGGTEVEIGIVMALHSGAGIVCQPLIGPWVDAVGRRPFMLAGVALVFGSALLAAVTPGIAALGLVRVLQGIGFSAYFVASFAYVVDLVPPARRGWALGIYGVSGLVSTAVAPVLGEWVIRRFGFPPLFVLAAAFVGVAGVLVWRLSEASRPQSLPVRGAGATLVALGDALQRHMVVAVFFGLGSGTVFAFLPTFAESLGITTLSLFYTAYAGAAMAVRIVGGRLIDTHGRVAVIVPSMFVQALATALLAGLGLAPGLGGGVPALPVLFVAGLLAGGAHGFLYPGLAALVTDRTPEARRAGAIGVFSAMFLVGQTGGAFAFGHVAHSLGYAPMWAVLTALLLVGALVALRLSAAGR
jgi:MFS family permease